MKTRYPKRVTFPLKSALKKEAMRNLFKNNLQTE